MACNEGSVSSKPREWLNSKSIRAISFFHDGRTHSIFSKQSRQARERLVKLIRIAQGRFKKRELLLSRSARLRFQRDGNNGLVRRKILQMRVQHPKEKIDIVGWLRDGEFPFVTFFVGKSNPQSDFFGDQVNRVQTQCELLQKRRSIKSSGSTVSISFSNSKFSANNSGAE